MSQASVLATETLKSSKRYCFFFCLLVALGLHYSARVPQYSDCSRCGAQALGTWASVVATHGLSAPWHVKSSRTWDGSHIPCTGRESLMYCTTREVLVFLVVVFMLTTQSECLLHAEPLVR